MTTYSQGDVVLLPFPFTDLSTTKRRPAVIVSADWFNRLRSDYVFVAITSQVPSNPSRDELSLDQSDLVSAGLPKPFIVKLGKIVTVQQTLIVKPLGKILPTTLTKILDGVRAVMTP